MDYLKAPDSCRAPYAPYAPYAPKCLSSTTPEYTNATVIATVPRYSHRVSFPRLGTSGKDLFRFIMDCIKCWQRVWVVGV